jgi:hypothetical protein
MKVFTAIVFLTTTVMAQLTDKDIDEEVSAVMKGVQSIDANLSKLSKNTKAYLTGGGSGN